MGISQAIAINGTIIKPKFTCDIIYYLLKKDIKRKIKNKRNTSGIINAIIIIYLSPMISTKLNCTFFGASFSVKRCKKEKGILELDWRGSITNLIPNIHSHHVQSALAYRLLVVPIYEQV